MPAHRDTAAGASTAPVLGVEEWHVFVRQVLERFVCRGAVLSG